MANIPFSAELENWLQTKQTKTVGDMQAVFSEKSFAILFLLFMFLPSLPIPTGGLTDFVLTPIVILASLQMMFGRRTLWLPNFIMRIQLGKATIDKALPFMMRRIRWFERFSRPRLESWLINPIFRSIAGFFVFLFALSTIAAPPFSGLDTLPALGAVIIALSIILEDILLFVVGLFVGSIGIGILVATAGAVTKFVQMAF